MRLVLTVFVLLQFVIGTAQKNITLLGHLTYNPILNDVWGYVDNNGNEYALVGATTGTSIVDVTDPENPFQLFFINGPFSIWRDMKTWDGFGYVTNETDSGLLIIDLRFLPDSIHYQNVILEGDMRTAHNLFVDENGVAYIFGSNVSNQGALMYDLTSTNRFNPPLIGMYDERYVHDGYVRGDTLWTAEILQGDFSVLDISDKQNPVVMARRQTSGNFTHNCWLSDDGNYLITTDEIDGGAVDIYDVSNLNNIRRLDSYRSNPGSMSVPHNTFFLGDYIFTAYYRDGLTLVDATRKNNLVEVGFYDTSPLSGPGFEGAWGVYPYLPSGNILVSDREEGLFIVKPDYKRAAYIEGNVTDSNTGLPVNNMRVELMGTSYIKFTGFNGNYRNGSAAGGLYDVRFFHPNCRTFIATRVELTEGEVTVLNISTPCDFTVSVYNQSEFKAPQFYPNPAMSELNVMIDNPAELISFHIFNVNGALVYSSHSLNESEFSIDLNNWNSGLYVVKLTYSDRVFTEKIIKK
jgi:choice-of-anchor B domain-containing protein